MKSFEVKLVLDQLAQGIKEVNPEELLEAIKKSRAERHKNRPKLTEDEPKDWYESHVERPVRDLVRLLRDNGFNTECSCGHEDTGYDEGMYAQCQFVLEGELQNLHHLLVNNGYENYKAEVIIQVIDGRPFSSLNIYIGRRC